MKTIVIDRSKWRTGSFSELQTGEGQTRLKNAEGYMCCLGFICSAYKKRVIGVTTPGGIGCSVPHLTSFMGSFNGVSQYRDTELACKAMDINDCPNHTAQEKEPIIKELFKDAYDIQFVGEYK